MTRVILVRFVLGAALMMATVAPSYPMQESPLGAVTGTFSFDFVDVDVRVVVSALAEAAGVNVMFGHLPERSVTLRTSRPITHSELLPLLRTLVSNNGLLLREDSTVLTVEGVSRPPQDGAVVSGGSPSLRVYRIKHTRAERLAATLQQLFGGSGTETRSGLSRSGLTEELRGQQIEPVPPEAAERLPPMSITLPGQVRGSVQIVPDEHSNSLLINAKDEDWAIIQQALEALDLRPLQVLIEVVIAEVRRTSESGLGISVDFPEHQHPSGARISGEVNGPTAGDLALKVMSLGNIRADVLITAISARADVTILSRPVVLAQNNREARILVGSQRPFIQVFRALPTDAAVRDQVVQYRDVGTSLTVLPTINHDGFVSLELVQEVSTATNETQFGAPIISTREASTHLLVRDKQTVVIGGLIDRQTDRTRTGIPFLKDIPLVGALFGSSTGFSTNTELFLFITPHIIRNDQDADALEEAARTSAEHLERLLNSSRQLRQDSIK